MSRETVLSTHDHYRSGIGMGIRSTPVSVPEPSVSSRSHRYCLSGRIERKFAGRKRRVTKFTTIRCHKKLKKENRSVASLLRHRMNQNLWEYVSPPGLNLKQTRKLRLGTVRKVSSPYPE